MVKTAFVAANEAKDDFLKNQLYGGNGYRENEVNLLIPNRRRTTKEKRECEAEGADAASCHILGAFKKRWISAIRGVVAFGGSHCSNTDGNPQGFNCTMEQCCCSEGLSAQIALRMVEHFNRKYARNIRAYNWTNATRLDNFVYDRKSKSTLELYALSASPPMRHHSIWPAIIVLVVGTLLGLIVRRLRPSRQEEHADARGVELQPLVENSNLRRRSAVTKVIPRD